MTVLPTWRSLLANVVVGVWACGGMVVAAEVETRTAHQWHQWRGPLATGEAPHADPPLRWDEQTNIRFKTPLPGVGNSSPIVWGDHIFILSAAATKTSASADTIARHSAANEGQLTKPPEVVYRLLVLDIDRATGDIRWQRVAREIVPHEGIHQTNTYASASAITDGRYVYASFGSAGIYCYDFDGHLVWDRDLGDMRTRKGWGEGASPALYHETLLVNWDHEGESQLFALETASGETRWQVSRDEPTSWSTPLVIDDPQRPQVIIAATNAVCSYDPRDGKLLWQCSGLTTNVIPTPVADNRNVYSASWYGDSAVLAIPLSSVGIVTNGKLSWSYDRMAPYCPSPLLLSQRLYVTQANRTVMAALSVGSGEPAIEPTRMPHLSGNMYASPVAADGRIYIVDRQGTTLVLSQGDDPQVLAINRLDDRIDASPAIVGLQIILRGRENLYCIEQSNASSSHD